LNSNSDIRDKIKWIERGTEVRTMVNRKTVKKNGSADKTVLSSGKKKGVLIKKKAVSRLSESMKNPIKNSKTSQEIVQGADKKRILVIDDDESFCDTMKDILSMSGYVAEVAFDGETAKEKILEGYFNMALLDLNLPDINGIDLLKWIKKDSPRTVVMMITGYAALSNAVEALNFGANAYIMKPVNPREFLSFIETKLSEQGEKEVGALEQFLPSYLDTIKDGNMWSTHTVAFKLKVPLMVVERTSNFCAGVGLIKYWKNKGVVQRLNVKL
jgi:CheY-like chemotaxis protein